MGVDHLSNAVAVCGQPQQLLQVLQQTLPPQVFQMLLMKLPVAGQVSGVCEFVLLFILMNWCLQCFDAVGWVAGRAYGL